VKRRKKNKDASKPKGGPGMAEHSGPPRFEPGGGARIDKTIAVMSGKGGVGKSAVATLIAVELKRRGNEVGILDADVTGPSIPRGLGVSGGITVGPEGAIPAKSSTGIQVMSMNLILPAEQEAVIWRGPLVSGAVRQFYEECEWGDLDYLVLDLPPGTSDVPLTIMQSIDLDGIILVTSPQELVGVIVGKAQKMAGMLDVPVLGLVENMSYVTCPKCGEDIYPFGRGNAEEVASSMGTSFLGRLPLDPDISKLADGGKLEEYESEAVSRILDEVLKSEKVRNA
jgi:ATP-binding protein involved in chromosome partitioning